MRFFNTNRGFTLVEMLGVISIIAILLSVVLFNVQAGKQKARDAQRLSDLGQIQVATRVYRDVNSTNTLPSADAGALFTGSVLENNIAEYVGGTLTDPLNTGEHQYYYDSDYDCSGSKAVVIALAMERTNAGNSLSLCGGTGIVSFGNGVSTGVNSYIVILK